ncbi:MAG TPA: hypothetical protein VFG76_01195 [Candidatus Polarisedimenticolia bacterium]|nr:hypothetical protein [Candidatus Polarisedimenticolia bacterium]
MKTIQGAALVLLLAASWPAALARASSSVDLAELGRLPAEALDGLRDGECEVFVAQARLAAAEADEKTAGDEERSAKRRLKIETQDLKAAESEAQAAKASARAAGAVDVADPTTATDAPPDEAVNSKERRRLVEAKRRLGEATADHDLAQAYVEWRSAQTVAAEDGIRMAQATLDAAEARRDLARAKMLNTHAGTARFDLAALEAAMSKAETAAAAEAARAAGSRDRSAQAKAAWEALAPPQQ